MKGLSLTQPWATLVAIGAKRIETRGWSTKYRGPVAIHAARGLPAEATDLARESPFREALASGGYSSAYDLPRGAIVATATLAACFIFSARKSYQIPVASNDPGKINWREVMIEGWEAAFGDYTPGRYGFLLDDVRALTEPIPCRGNLNLWPVPEEIADRLRAG